MKALSLWQPWASAVALGSKRIETRSWSTKHRGPLAIHAAKRCVQYEMDELASSWTWCGVLGFSMGAHGSVGDRIPFGAIVAICDLVDCRPSESFTVGELDVRRGDRQDAAVGLYSFSERILGDFAPGRFGWVLENIRRIDPAVPCRGRQGLFEVPAGLLPGLGIC